MKKSTKEVLYNAWFGSSLGVFIVGALSLFMKGANHDTPEPELFFSSTASTLYAIGGGVSAYFSVFHPRKDPAEPNEGIATIFAFAAAGLLYATSSSKTTQKELKVPAKTLAVEFNDTDQGYVPPKTFVMSKADFIRIPSAS